MDQHIVLQAGAPAADGAQAAPHAPLFTSAWWLEAASNGTYETVTTKWDGQITGTLSFARFKRLGMTSLRMPNYTRTLGPIVAPPPSKPVQRAANIRRIINELAASLPPHDDFTTTLDPAADPAIAFAFDVAQFKVGHAFTFRIDPATRLDKLWSALEGRTRNAVRTAEKRLAIVDTTNFDRFERLSRIERPGPENTHEFTTLRRLFEAAHGRGQAILRCAVQHDGADAAAIILLWDERTMYYWVCARNRQSQDGNGASTLLLWEGIRTANARGLIFDVDGYCSVGSARFLAGFVWEPKVRAVITKSSFRYRLAKSAQELAGRR